MTSGGARARSGPPPEPDAFRRDRDKATWRHLPASGREGDPPAWPLSRATPRELILWAGEWRRPQAVVWEERGQALEVAMYVRAVRHAENAKATPPARALVLRYMDDLGISTGGLAKNRWVIADDSRREDAAAAAPREGGNRSQLLELVVDNVR